MNDNRTADELANEIRGLRERIAELERRLTRHRLGEIDNGRPTTGESLAERAVAERAVGHISRAGWRIFCVNPAKKPGFSAQ